MNKIEAQNLFFLRLILVVLDLKSPTRFIGTW